MTFSPAPCTVSAPAHGSGITCTPVSGVFVANASVPPRAGSTIVPPANSAIEKSIR